MRVSCVIPVCNGRAFIADAIESVLAQSRPVDEIVVVDDGSEDDTVTAVRQFGARVRYLRQPNRGAAAARNVGLKAATGDCIALLDADDLWDAHKLEAQLGALDDRRVGACATHMLNFWMPDVASELEYGVREHLTAVNLGVSSTLLLRSDVLRQVGPLDETLRHRDIHDWLIRMQESGWRLAILSDVLVRRRIHGGNVSRRNAERQGKELLKLAQRALDRRRGESEH